MIRKRMAYQRPVTSYRKSLLFCATICAMSLSTPARAAQYMNGEALLSNCAGASISYGLCIGYIEGVVDYADIVRLKLGFPACVPPGVEAGKLSDIVVNYLRDNPTRRKLAASLLIIDAVNAEWSCKELVPNLGHQQFGDYLGHPINGRWSSARVADVRVDEVALIDSITIREIVGV